MLRLGDFRGIAISEHVEDEVSHQSNEMDKCKISQIPHPGGSGNVPTGAMQFQENWPGVFLRGDDAGFLAKDVRQLEQLLREQCKVSLPESLKHLVAIIERDRIVRNEALHGEE